jgi:hypothetical protein
MWVTVAAAGTPLPFMSKHIMVDRGGGAACTREHQLRGLKTAVGGRGGEGRGWRRRPKRWELGLGTRRGEEDVGGRGGGGGGYISRHKCECHLVWARASHVTHPGWVNIERRWECGCSV